MKMVQFRYGDFVQIFLQKDCLENMQNIETIPDDIKALYKTVWEIPQKIIINMAADRGAFIDQSQSLNIHIAEPNMNKLSSMHFYAWKKVHFKLCYN